MRYGFAFSIAMMVSALLGCLPPKTAATPWTTSADGLGVMELSIGTCPSPRTGQTVVVEAVGWVEENGARGRVILDTRKRGYPATFPLGVGRVIKGWDEGLATMKPGGKRLLRVPPPLGYTPAEAGKDVPAGATLIFEIELIEIR